MDSRARKNLSSINTELQDVQRIMVQNIDDVLQRGDSLSGLFKKIRKLEHPKNIAVRSYNLNNMVLT